MGGGSVSVGGGKELAGSVAVIMKRVGVEKSGEFKLKPQPVKSRAAIMKKKRGLSTRLL